MKTFIQFYAENDVKADIDAYYRFVANCFVFEKLSDLFFGILNGNEFVGEDFAFTSVKNEIGESEIIVHRYCSTVNDYTKVREAIACYPEPFTIDDFFAILYNLILKHPDLYRAWEKAFELRKKVNIQSLKIEI